jgi:hypothetical protein
MGSREKCWGIGALGQWKQRATINYYYCFGFDDMKYLI